MDRSAERVSARLDRPASPLTPALSDLLSRGASPTGVTPVLERSEDKPPVSGEKPSLSRSMASRLSLALILADVGLVALGLMMAVRAPTSFPSWLASLIGAVAVVLGGWLAWLAYWVRGLSRP